MNLTFAIPLSLAAMIPVTWAQNAPVVQMRDAATHEQLSQAYRKADEADPMRKMKASTGADPSVVNQPKDLISQSDILCFGGVATLVPKRAILSVPKNMADRLKFIQGSKIVSWSDFHASNGGWITTVEISRPQAEGNVPMDEKMAERVQKSANLVVATYQGGPISMLPLKEKKDPAAEKKDPAAVKKDPAAVKEESKTPKK